MPVKRSPPAPDTVEFGFNVYGYLTGNLGLGVAARNTVQTLLHNHHLVRLTDVSPGPGMQGRDVTLAERIGRGASLPAYAVNLFHLNPDQMLFLIDPWSGRVTLPGRLNVGVPFWELPQLPPSWVAPLAALDVILAPSQYVGQAIAAALPEARVLPYPQAVHLPADIGPDRSRFGLSGSQTVFVMSFDLRSDVERKNPWAAVEAFLQAFPPHRSDVCLVIKANNVETLPGLGRHLQRLRHLAQDARVRVLDGPMSYRDVLTLYASSDVLVSLHRAEGLGLSLLEAMSLGRPVVATAYSGPMDFINERNACLVGYDLVPVGASTQPLYGRSWSGAQEWAQPRVAEAAAWMARLADAPQWRRQLGAQAQVDAARRAASYDRGEVFAQLGQLAHEARCGTAAHQCSQQRLEALARGYPWRLAGRIVRVGWRRTVGRLFA
jgi:glycosyltransferase involved in cell wall biosynthesis